MILKYQKMEFIFTILFRVIISLILGYPEAIIRKFFIREKSIKELWLENPYLNAAVFLVFLLSLIGIWKFLIK